MKRILSASLDRLFKFNSIAVAAKEPIIPLVTSVRWKKSGTDESYLVLPPSKTKVYLGNLPNGCTGVDVLQLVEPFGTIESCHKVAGKRMAFVNFESEKAALDAVSGLNGTTLADRQLVVDFSTSSKFRSPSSSWKSPKSKQINSLKYVNDHLGNSRTKVLDERFMDHTEIDGKPQYNSEKDGDYFWQDLFWKKESLEKNKNRTNLEDLMFMIHRFGHVSVKSLLKCVEQLEQTGITNVNNAMLILRCTGSLLQDLKAAERQVLTERVWKVFENSDIELTVPIFNTLLDVFAANQHDFNGFLFLAKMQTLGLHPNYTTFELLIKSYCMKGDMDSVSKLIDYIHREDFILTHSVFHMLITGNFKDKNEGAALQVLDIMRDQGLQPDFSTYCILMTCYCEDGNMEGLNWVIQEMEDRGMPIKSYVLFDCIHKLVVNGHEQHVLSVLHLLSYDDKYYYKDAIAVIKKLIADGFEKQAYLLYLNFFTDDRHHAAVDELRGRFLLKPLVHNSEFEVIRSIICDLKDKGELRAISETARIAITANKIDLSFKLFQLMVEMGEPVWHHMFYPILTTFSKEKDINNILLTFDRIRDLAADFTPTVLLNNLILFVFPMGDNVKDLGCIDVLEAAGHNRQEVNFAYYIYLITKKEKTAAAKFVAANEVTVCFPLLLHIKDLCYLPWEDIMNLLKGCHDLSNHVENETFGEVLSLIIADHEKYIIKVLNHFMSLNLKLRKDDADKICKQYDIPGNIAKKLKANHVYGSQRKGKSAGQLT